MGIIWEKNPLIPVVGPKDLPLAGKLWLIVGPILGQRRPLRLTLRKSGLLAQLLQVEKLELDFWHKRGEKVFRSTSPKKGSQEFYNKRICEIPEKTNPLNERDLRRAYVVSLFVTQGETIKTVLCFKKPHFFKPGGKEGHYTQQGGEEHHSRSAIAHKLWERTPIDTQRQAFWGRQDEVGSTSTQGAEVSQ